MDHQLENLGRAIPTVSSSIVSCRISERYVLSGRPDGGPDAIRTTLPDRGNDLRQTYRTAAQATGIADLDIHPLMNHSVPGVNAGYINRSKLLSDHLRQQQEMISRKM